MHGVTHRILPLYDETRSFQTATHGHLQVRWRWRAARCALFKLRPPLQAGREAGEEKGGSRIGKFISPGSLFQNNRISL